MEPVFQQGLPSLLAVSQTYQSHTHLRAITCTFPGTFLACPHSWFSFMSPSQKGHTLCGKGQYTPSPAAGGSQCLPGCCPGPQGTASPKVSPPRLWLVANG